MTKQFVLAALFSPFVVAGLAAQHQQLRYVMEPDMPAPVQTSAERFASPGWWRPISSAIIPGSGQLMAGQDRGVIYLAVEAFLLVQVFSSRGQGVAERDRYTDLAFGVARAPFAPARRDTVFEYFEQLERFVDSGPFDTDPGPVLVPPIDEFTYNGSVWKLARETFLPDPAVPDTSSVEYQRALEFYRSRAVGPNFQWSWRDAGLEQNLYSQSIKRSDDAFRNSTQYLGLLLANHLLSAVDAFVSYRLSGNGKTVQLESAVRPVRGTTGVFEAQLGMRVEF